MLWRALSGVRGGFYIDVGAGHPVRDSVTRAFYERGWHGINIDPDPGCFAALDQRRERDVAGSGDRSSGRRASGSEGGTAGL